MLRYLSMQQSMPEHTVLSIHDFYLLIKVLPVHMITDLLSQLKPHKQHKPQMRQAHEGCHKVRHLVRLVVIDHENRCPHQSG